MNRELRSSLNARMHGRREPYLRLLDTWYTALR